VLLFHNHNFFLKAFTCSSLTSPRFSGKNSSGNPKSVFSDSYCIHSFARNQQVQHNFLIVRCIVISQDVFSHPLKRQSCISFSLIQVFIELSVLHHFPDLGSYKCTLSDVCVTHIWELIPHILESTAGFIDTFHKAFHEAQLYMQREQKNFLRKNKRRIDDIFLPWRQ